jgi:hypothetical protein
MAILRDRNSGREGTKKERKLRRDGAPILLKPGYPAQSKISPTLQPVASFPRNTDAPRETLGPASGQARTPSRFSPCHLTSYLCCQSPPAAAVTRPHTSTTLELLFGPFYVLVLIAYPVLSLLHPSPSLTSDRKPSSTTPTQDSDEYDHVLYLIIFLRGA